MNQSKRRLKQPKDGSRTCISLRRKLKSSRLICWQPSAQTSDDHRLKKNRKIIDHHLHGVGNLFGKHLSLNSDGMCYFAFKKFVIVVEVPKDSSTACIIYTMVSRLEHGDNREEVMNAALRLNYLQIGSRGATIGLSGDELNLCFSAPISSLRFNDMVNYLQDFMCAAQEIHVKLEAAKCIPRWTLEETKARIPISDSEEDSQYGA